MSRESNRPAWERARYRRSAVGRLDSAPPGRGAAWATGFALLFLLLSLLALVLVPQRLEEDVRGVRDQIKDVLEPAVGLATNVQSLQARQMEAFYSFLLVGDAASRVRYREAREEEQVALDSLAILTEGMSIRVREEMANVGPLSFSWSLGHEEMLARDLSGDTPPPELRSEAARQRLMTEQASYAEVVSAAADLREVLVLEMQASETTMSSRRVLQAEYTRALVVLGLVATLVVLILAWRLRFIMIESENRRLDALIARREADGLLRATGDGVLGMDLEGRCTFLNRAGAELLGYSLRGVVGRDVHSLLHHSYPDGQPLPREECSIFGAVASGETVSGLTDTLWRSGSKPFPVQVSVRPMMDGPELRGAVLSFTDMTGTRAAEASLRQALQARDEVLAVVSHDLRNPVGTIFSAASLLLTLDPSPEKRREHLLAVKRSAERINRLIKDLLDVAQLEVGVLSVHPGPFHPERLINEVVDANRGRAEEGELSFELSVPENIPKAWGDPHRVVQALTNLVENALRETPPGGKITLGVEVDASGNGLRFSVADTGSGIKAEDQERLFDRFWQVSRKDTGGAGLGLSIVKGIVEAHDGQVWVESDEGKGSTFWFQLPRQPEEKA
jgi:PAS domain S-box-containing protein